MQGLARRRLSVQASGMINVVQLHWGNFRRTQSYSKNAEKRRNVEVVLRDDKAMTKYQELLVVRLKKELCSLSKSFFRAGQVVDWRCIVSTTSKCCNADATVGDALKKMIPGKFAKGKSGVVTANVFYPHARFIPIETMDEDQKFYLDLVYPVFEDITLRSNTKLWKAQELVNEKQESMEDGCEIYSRAIRNHSGFFRNSEIFWKLSEGGKLVLINNYCRTKQQRLWLQLSHKG